MNPEAASLGDQVEEQVVDLATASRRSAGDHRRRSPAGQLARMIQRPDGGGWDGL